MANQLASNPWIIDTPSANVIFQGMMSHVQVEFIGYTAAGQIAEVQDRNGRTVAYLKGAADFTTQRSGRIGLVQGVKVPTTTSDAQTNLVAGRILLYYE